MIGFFHKFVSALLWLSWQQHHQQHKKYITTMSNVWEFLLFRANHCSLFFPQVCLYFAFIRVFFDSCDMHCFVTTCQWEQIIVVCFSHKFVSTLLILEFLFFCSFVIGIALWQLVIESKSLWLVSSTSLFQHCFHQSFCFCVL